MRTRLPLALALAALGLTGIAHAQAQPQDGDTKGRVDLHAAKTVKLVDTFNGGGVQNNPSAGPSFTISAAHVITLVRTYHWNGGKGTAAPGTLSFVDAKGKVFGPFKAKGTPGQGGVANAFWDATPNVSLPAGTYTVQDSDKATWSFNAQSGGKGFALVQGHP